MRSCDRVRCYSYFKECCFIAFNVYYKLSTHQCEDRRSWRDILASVSAFVGLLPLRGRKVVLPVRPAGKSGERHPFATILDLSTREAASGSRVYTIIMTAHV